MQPVFGKALHSAAPEGRFRGARATVGLTAVGTSAVSTPGRGPGRSVGSEGKGGEITAGSDKVYHQRQRGLGKAPLSDHAKGRGIPSSPAHGQIWWWRRWRGSAR